MVLESKKDLTGSFLVILELESSRNEVWWSALNSRALERFEWSGELDLVVEALQGGQKTREHRENQRVSEGRDAPPLSLWGVNVFKYKEDDLLV